jgi:hypothetical protein
VNKIDVAASDGPRYKLSVAEIGRSIAAQRPMDGAMSLILCHQCFSWVEPLGEQCPQCDFPLDARAPDPSPTELNAAIGQVVRRIGECRIARAVLPDRGSLYETTQGLFFVPHRLEQVKIVHGETSPRPLRTILAACLKTPWRLLSGAPGRRQAARMEIAVDEHRLLGPEDSGTLSLLLMQNPGVFFLARRSIDKVRWTLWGWTISRPNSLVLRVKPIVERGRFHERMSAWAAEIDEAVCS